MPRALVIPVEGALLEVELALGDRSQLSELQELVGGKIEALRLPDFLDHAGRCTAYINEEGKLIGLPFNGRATDLFVPGAGLVWGDYLAGPVVLMGFDPERGVNLDVPLSLVDAAVHIADEAGGYEPVVVNNVVVAEARTVDL